VVGSLSQIEADINTCEGEITTSPVTGLEGIKSEADLVCDNTYKHGIKKTISPAWTLGGTTGTWNDAFDLSTCDAYLPGTIYSLTGPASG
jgi:hypothetical protein